MLTLTSPSVTCNTPHLRSPALTCPSSLLPAWAAWGWARWQSTSFLAPEDPAQESRWVVERSLEGREDGTEGHRAAGEQVAGPIHKLEEGGQGRDGEKVGGLRRTTLGNPTLHSRLAQPPPLHPELPVQGPRGLPPASRSPPVTRPCSLPL